MPEPLIKPRALRPGDFVGIVAPASPVRLDLLEKGEAVLLDLGLRVRRGDNLLRRGRYTAGSVEERVRDLGQMLADPEVRAVLVARGGYGSGQLLPYLDPTLLRRDPKLLMGASDATALLLWALNAGVTSIHGPMPAREFQEGRIDPADVLRHLCDPSPPGAIVAPALRSLHPGSASGLLTGGCLSLVTASLGTPWEIRTDGTLLFLEDTDTKPYQIDRMLTQLRQAGKLDGISGLVFGEMPRCAQHPDQGYTLDDVLRDLTADLGVPVLAGLPCGHTAGLHRLLPLGVRATIDATPPRLRLEEAAVS